MNCKRFTARTSREALTLVRQAFGEDAVVLSTKPCAEGVEVLAMAPEGMAHIEQISASAPKVSAPAVKQTPPARKGKGLAERIEPEIAAPVEDDVRKLSMSTLSFQDFVRERMLKRRQEAMSEVSRFPDDAVDMPIIGSYTEVPPAPPQAVAQPVPQPVAAAPLQQRMSAPTAAVQPPKPAIAVPVLHDTPAAEPAAPVATRRDQEEMIRELRQVKGLIEERFGALAFMEKLQREPRQAQLAQRLLASGFSPALIRKLVAGLPSDTEEMAWAAGVLERNLVTAEREPALEDAGGVFALIGATGVGKTTSTAKLAAAFATKHGAANLGLITLDAYRVAAHEQLRAYGRILGVPVHTAHDRASLEDLLELLAGKRMVLIDTAGMAQRDTRTRELLDMLSHRAIQRLLVLNASAQGETIEDQIAAYAGAGCRGVVLSKLDEAVKLGPALDAMVRHRLKVLAVANGQRVPEDWHRLSGGALVQRALKGGGTAAWKHDDHDVSLIFAGAPVTAASTAAALAATL
ncbi:MAG: flagellar biosynthesis protein FlhF [Rubrivivax sp.]|nr:flagellar biosynthesis protein FlhF [Rubrivivax sp.]